MPPFKNSDEAQDLPSAATDPVDLESDGDTANEGLMKLSEKAVRLELEAGNDAADMVDTLRRRRPRARSS